ncbi:ABC transporter substrate-binding protein [Myxococcota bacterium]|nr:ABC transporter substrate-binding protein [Myxococcota bacterium]MCZ7617272.1 helical backbone metal receptor [Myxococcota bacterium]
MRLVLVAGLLVSVLAVAAGAAEPGSDAVRRASRPTAGPARRVVSMNPSLTRILVALGARDALVGVDEFSARAEPRVAALPRVGGLYSPSLEAVVALQPDLVALVPSLEQRAFRAQLEALDVPVLVLDPVRFDDVLHTITVLGARVGRVDAARVRVEAIRSMRDAARRATRARRHPRTVLVLQREPLFVVGAGNFLDEMIAMAGGRNLGAELDESWPRSSIEWLVAAAPEVILDSDDDVQPAAEYWGRWPSLPAVRDGRVIALDPGAVTLPGPELDRALALLARSLHGVELDLGGGP